MRDYGTVKPAKTFLRTTVETFFIALTLSACSAATTPIVTEWYNPVYALAPFKRIMVGGPSGNTSVRCNFEDEFVIQLTAVGVDALASYTYIPEDQGIDENKLRQAAQEAN